MTGVGETCASVAASHGLDLFDVLWLNRRRFPELNSEDILNKGTRLQLPEAPDLERVRMESAAFSQVWHVVSEDSTLRKEVSQRLQSNAIQMWTEALFLSIFP